MEIEVGSCPPQVTGVLSWVLEQKAGQITVDIQVAVLDESNIQGKKFISVNYGKARLHPVEEAR